MFGAKLCKLSNRKIVCNVVKYEWFIDRKVETGCLEIMWKPFIELLIKLKRGKLNESSFGDRYAGGLHGGDER